MGQEHNLSEQLKLFTYEPSPPQDLTDTWAHRSVWHSSRRDRLPTESNDVDDPTDPDEGDYAVHNWNSYSPHPLGFHVGTAYAARERVGTWGEARVLHPLALSGDDAIAPRESRNDDYGDSFWGDDQANGADFRATEAVRGGQNVAYVNDYEDVGSVSHRAPRQNLHTWAEHVLKFPDKHTTSERGAALAGYDLVYAPGKVTPHPHPPGLTASPMEAAPEGAYAGTDDYYDYSDDYDPYESGDSLGDIVRARKTLYPAFVQPEKPPKKPKVKPEPHPRLPGMG